MSEDNISLVIEVLLECITIINAATGEDAILEGVISGRQIAQVLTQINTQFADDEKICKIANIQNDEEVSQQDAEKFYRLTILPKLAELFDSSIYSYETCEDWQVEPSDIVSGKARSVIQKHLEETSEPAKSRISELLNSFLQSVKKPVNSMGTSSDVVQNAKKENEELLAEISRLQIELLNSKRNEDDQLNVRSSLTEAEARIKHLESTAASHMEHLLQAQKQVAEFEFENEKLQRKLNTQEIVLTNLRAENKELMDDCETLRSTEAQLKRDLKNTEKQSSISERDLAVLKNKEKELEMTKQRINVSLEQMLNNGTAQREELKEELQVAIQRANIAEAEVLSFRCNFSLHDELSGSMSLADSCEETNHRSSEEFAELKTKYELIQMENNRLKNELKENKEIYEKVSMSSDSRIANEKGEIERLEEKTSKLEAQKSQDLATIAKLEKHLDSAANVIRFYSTASDGRESSAENLKLRSENDKLQKELENLRQKMDQYRYESCQEQRIITSNWYHERTKNCRLALAAFKKEMRIQMKLVKWVLQKTLAVNQVHKSHLLADSWKLLTVLATDKI
uniref:HOOK N-terminal domain-containing protein n=1 Tax=Ditylenchus dipsaci TaxID=166011 RepID=A0A915DS25_9BILA